ncbi:MAG TPA: SAM-dependent methyltransferase [Syntrophobacteraceae bacterium]|nr:SAM-dependent methyltransferase [Syntrophobacteraceae bacterium]
MKKFLLEMLICPACLPEETELRADIMIEQAEDVVEATLRCPRCASIYPIQDGTAFLGPPSDQRERTPSKYETEPVLSSYLWSHYGDLLGDEQASSAYRQWASLMDGGSGAVLDVGSAVGRFAFEMSRKRDLVVGIDNSVAFIKAARELMANGRRKLALRQEGHLSREETLTLLEGWQTDRIEFIVADALALPFRSHSFSGLASLNIIDKVPLPLQHLRELNRVARASEAQLLFSDPFSWSTEAAREEDWLGGKDSGPYSGRGIDNVMALLQGEDRQLLPAWRIRQQGHVWWKIRTHANHFELIRSCFVTADR